MRDPRDLAREIDAAYRAASRYGDGWQSAYGALEAALVERDEAARLCAGRVYHVRYRRALDALAAVSPCACPDCAPFDETDPGDDGMDELRRLRRLEQVVAAALVAGRGEPK